MVGGALTCAVSARLPPCLQPAALLSSCRRHPTLHCRTPGLKNACQYAYLVRASSASANATTTQRQLSAIVNYVGGRASACLACLLGHRRCEGSHICLIPCPVLHHPNTHTQPSPSLPPPYLPPCLQLIYDDSIYELLPGIANPVLMAAGLQDEVVPAANSRAMAELLPHPWLVTYAGGAHAAFIQHQPAFLQVLSAFLADA